MNTSWPAPTTTRMTASAWPAPPPRSRFSPPGCRSTIAHPEGRASSAMKTGQRRGSVPRSMRPVDIAVDAASGLACPHCASLQSHPSPGLLCCRAASPPALQGDSAPPLRQPFIVPPRSSSRLPAPGILSAPPTSIHLRRPSHYEVWPGHAQPGFPAASTNSSALSSSSAEARRDLRPRKRDRTRHARCLRPPCCSRSSAFSLPPDGRQAAGSGYDVAATAFRRAFHRGPLSLPLQPK